MSGAEKSGYIRELLERKHNQFNVPGFIPDDPVSVPRSFSLLQDIEISGFFAAVLAWGQRKTIISKCRELMALMDGAPYDFIKNHEDRDLRIFESFKHRTFNATDTLYFLSFLKNHYRQFHSLEDAFIRGMGPDDEVVDHALSGFHNYFCDTDYFPARTRKHIATPLRGSSCKRLNMFLRWMVRKDDRGVDFGLWSRISASQLVCPCDVHVDRVARSLGLITKTGTGWATALELTQNLRSLDPLDPVRYDFALFGLGIEGTF